MRRGTLTCAGHSTAHILQLTHRSAAARSPLAPRRLSQRPYQGPRRRPDDLAGIEQAPWIEDGLQLSEYGIEPAVLPAHPGRARQAGPVATADRAAQLQHDVVDLVGQ